MTSTLEVYLRNHEAAARAGSDLFRRVARQQRSRTYGRELEALRDEVIEDLSTLQQLMTDWSVRPDVVASVALRLGERVGRLKPNGGLLRRTPLADLIEIEGCTDAVHAKLAGWRALIAAGLSSDQDRVSWLAERAEKQAERLWILHAEASSALVR